MLRQPALPGRPGLCSRGGRRARRPTWGQTAQTTSARHRRPAPSCRSPPAPRTKQPAAPRHPAGAHEAAHVRMRAPRAARAAPAAGAGARLQRGQRGHLRDGLQRGLHRRVRALQAARAHDVRHQRRPAAADLRCQGGQGAGGVAAAAGPNVPRSPQAAIPTTARLGTQRPPGRSACSHSLQRTCRRYSGRGGAPPLTPHARRRRGRAPGGQLGARGRERGHAGERAQAVGRDGGGRRGRRRVGRHHRQAALQQAAQHGHAARARQLLAVQLRRDARQPAQLHRRLRGAPQRVGRAGHRLQRPGTKRGPSERAAAATATNAGSPAALCRATRALAPPAARRPREQRRRRGTRRGRAQQAGPQEARSSMPPPRAWPAAQAPPAAAAPLCSARLGRPPRRARCAPRGFRVKAPPATAARARAPGSARQRCPRRAAA